MTAAGYGWQGWGENIAYAGGPLNESMVHGPHDMLVNSPSDYANIIDGSFEEIGIGLKAGTINFVFDDVRDARGDTVVDFEHGADRIMLIPLDANALVEGDQPFTFIGTERFHQVAGELHVYHLADRNTYISGDTNSDGLPDFAIKALGWHTFTQDNFVL